MPRVRHFAAVCAVLAIAACRAPAAPEGGASVAPTGDETHHAATAGDVLRVVCFGDSITGDRPGKPYLHQYLKWTDILGAMLEVELGAGKAETLNMGYAGDRTFQAGDRPGAVNRVESDILAHEPDIAVIMIGGNNMRFAGLDQEELLARTQADLTDIVTSVRDAGIRVLLLQYPEPRAEDMARVWTHLDDVNPVIAAVAEAEGVETLELAPAFAAAAETVPLEALLNPIDGVHLQPYGEIIVARTVALKLKELGWLNSEEEHHDEVE